jgi:hypothetical protein
VVWKPRRRATWFDNWLEADHGALKRLINPTRGFKTLPTASATIKGFEVMRMIRKRQCLMLESGTAGEVRFEPAVPSRSLIRRLERDKLRFRLANATEPSEVLVRFDLVVWHETLGVCAEVHFCFFQRGACYTAWKINARSRHATIMVANRPNVLSLPISRKIFDYFSFYDVWQGGNVKFELL